MRAAPLPMPQARLSPDADEDVAIWALSQQLSLRAAAHPLAYVAPTTSLPTLPVWHTALTVTALQHSEKLRQGWSRVLGTSRIAPEHGNARSVGLRPGRLSSAGAASHQGDNASCAPSAVTTSVWQLPEPHETSEAVSTGLGEHARHASPTPYHPICSCAERSASVLCALRWSALQHVSPCSPCRRAVYCLESCIVQCVTV